MGRGTQHPFVCIGDHHRREDSKQCSCTQSHGDSGGGTKNEHGDVCNCSGSFTWTDDHREKPCKTPKRTTDFRRHRREEQESSVFLVQNQKILFSLGLDAGDTTSSTVEVFSAAKRSSDSNGDYVDEHKDVVVASREHLRFDLQVHRRQRAKAHVVLQTM